jgi:HK97 family phage portal protein
MKGAIDCYSQVGWLYAVISKIAQGVADADWCLYTDRKGELTEVENSPIMDVFNFVNPFQTRQEFIELHEIYMGLVGESFWVINRNKGGLPGEIWLAPPERMSVVPSKKDFIAGYIYKVGSESIPLDKELVIHHKLPNPSNPYRGLGPVQALAIDLDSELYAGKWNRNFFYNSARPDGVITFEGTLAEEQFDRLKKQWTERHGGTANAHKMAIMEGGGKYQQIQLSAKDMDFKELRLLNRDNILGVFGMPLSVMGITENVNRANAESGEYVFARWIVTPRLKRLQGKLNEQFLPMFPNSQNLILLPDDVVSETLEQKQSLAESGVRAGYMTINEAREIQGLDAIPAGDVLMTSLSMVPMPIDEEYEAPEPVIPPEIPPTDTNSDTTDEVTDEGKTVKKKLSSEWKEAYWRGYVTRAEAYERKMIIGLKEMFTKQETEALSKLHAGSRDLLDKNEAKVQYSKLATPILTDLLKMSVDNGRELINPKPVHTEAAPPEKPPLNPSALKWLLTRIGWAAEQIGEETARRLAEALAAGFAEGEGMPDIAKRVKAVFDDCSRRRSILVARTETIAASAQGAVEGYREADLQQAEFLAALDDRVCIDCDDMNGEIFELDDTTGVIPIHPDCRCCWIPVV